MNFAAWKSVFFILIQPSPPDPDCVRKCRTHGILHNRNADSKIVKLST